MKYSLEQKRLELDLSLSKSSVEIQESGDDCVELDFLGLRKRTVEELFSIGFRQNRLYLKEKNVRHSPVIEAIFSSAQACDIIIKVPKQSELSGRISTIKGDLKGGSINYQGELKTVTGKIVMEGITSERLDVQNIGGSILIGKFDGFLKGKTVTGSMTIENGLFKEIGIKTVSGDIRLGGTFELELDSEISTVSGNVDLDIRGFKSDRTLILSTLSGQTTVLGDYPAGGIEIKPRFPYIKNHPFKTVVPSLKEMFASFFSTMGKRSDVEVETEGEPHAKESEHTKIVLDMLSQGKITAAEAEKLIKALHGK